MAKKKNSSPVIQALGVLAILSAMIYLITRGVLLEQASYSRMDGVWAFLLLSAEAFILLHGIGYAMNILWSQKKTKDLADLLAGMPSLKKDDLPSVAILIPARHEPKTVLTETFITVNNITYPNKKVYFLDDSIKEAYKKEAEELAREHQLVLFRRTKPWHGAKAGIINDFLEQMSEKYVVVFDADSNPLPEFLEPLVRIMEAKENLAFVQTPQFYSNIEENRIARTAVLQQAVFYEYICEGKGTVDSMFCCGTNVILRTSALRAVGGMDESTVTEDFATSLTLHAHGFSSLFFNHVCAFGMGPEDLIGYYTQQFRWATGTIHVFKKLVALFLTRPFAMKPGQWFQYLLSGTYYLVGFAFLTLILGPLLYILFRVPSFFARPEVYFLSFLPYAFLSTCIFYFALRRRNYEPIDLIRGQLLGASTFWVYIKAAVAALSGVKVGFGVTSKEKGKAVPLIVLWPQILILLVNFTAVVWAANRFVYEHHPALIVNAFWAFCHFLIFSSIFYFNQDAS